MQFGEVTAGEAFDTLPEEGLLGLFFCPVRPYTVLWSGPNEDPRKGLWGQQGLETTAHLEENTVMDISTGVCLRSLAEWLCVTRGREVLAVRA